MNNKNMRNNNYTNNIQNENYNMDGNYNINNDNNNMTMIMQWVTYYEYDDCTHSCIHMYPVMMSRWSVTLHDGSVHDDHEIMTIYDYSVSIE